MALLDATCSFIKAYWIKLRSVNLQDTWEGRKWGNSFPTLPQSGNVSSIVVEYFRNECNARRLLTRKMGASETDCMYSVG